MGRRLVHLAERCDGDWIRRDGRKEGCRARLVAVGEAHAGRDGPTPPKLFLHHRPRQRVIVRHVGRLQPFERGGGLVADEVGTL